MNYGRIYQALIARASLANRRKGDGSYYESHHVIPKALGGGDGKENRVLLTAREHFVAHHLLTKMHPDSKAMQRAFWVMCNGASPDRMYVVRPAVYQLARERFSSGIGEVFRKARSGVSISASHKEVLRARLLGNQHSLGYRHSEEAKRKIAASAIGRRHSQQAREKIAAAKVGSRHSDATKEAIRLAKLGALHSAETRQKMSAAHRGKVKTPEHREKLRLSSLGEKSHRFGLHWFTDGVTSVMTKECPPGFTAGRTKGA